MAKIRWDPEATPFKVQMHRKTLDAAIQYNQNRNLPVHDLEEEKKSLIKYYKDKARL